MSVFADTSFFLALFNPTDDYHGSAVELAKSETRPLVMTNAILIELGNSLSASPRRNAFLRLLHLIESRGVRVVFVDRPLHDRAVEFFGARMDHDWSLTDCISFLVMQDLRITDAATADEHFTQAGFNRLLRRG